MNWEGGWFDIHFQNRLNAAESGTRTEGGINYNLLIHSIAQRVNCTALWFGNIETVIICKYIVGAIERLMYVFHI